MHLGQTYSQVSVAMTDSEMLTTDAMSKGGKNSSTKKKVSHSQKFSTPEIPKKTCSMIIKTQELFNPDLS